LEAPVRTYVAQGLLASGVMFVVLFLITLEHALIMVSMGATAFIIFAMPRSRAARARSVVGGHAIGMATGMAFSLLPHQPIWLLLAACSLAVGTSIVLMTVSRTHHPPASGTALGAALAGPSPGLVLGVLLGALILALARYCLGERLKDL